MERAEKVTAGVFDKTGTITEGKPAVTDVRGDATRVMQLALSLESTSEHSLAAPIVNKGKEMELAALPVDDFGAISGRGMRGIVHGQVVLLGNRALMEQNGIDSTKWAAAVEEL